MQPGNIVIDGQINERAWSFVDSIDSEFKSPWDKREAPKTVFRAAWDSNRFYFSFVCEDPDIIRVEHFAQESDVDYEDRVELFFAPYPIDFPHQPEPYQLPHYYALEIDPLGRVHDYSTVFYRHLDSDWSMKTLQAVARITREGYQVEGAVALSELVDLGFAINPGAKIKVGIFRAQFRTSKNESAAQDVSWLTWAVPNTMIPDFHVESAFGTLLFVQ